MGHVFYRSPVKSYPLAVRAEGVYLWDAAGKRYLDGSAGALVVNIGHGRVEVAEAMARQARELAFVHGSQFTSEPLERLADLVVSFARTKEDASGDWRFFAVSGGSEATETAIKLARQYHLERGAETRFKILSRHTSYHGASLGALAASGLVGRRIPYGPLIREEAFPKAPKPNPHQDGAVDARALEQVILEADPLTVAAVVLEPVIGASDPALAPARGYLEEVRRICDEHGILLIADEVMSGLGRSGLSFAYQDWQVTPDIIIVGKGLASGYAPLAGILANKAVHDVIKDGSGQFMHGFTYAGHPVSAAAGVSVLEIVERESLVERSRTLGGQLLEGLRAIAHRHAGVLEVRGRGLMAGLVLGDPLTKEAFGRPGIAVRVGSEAMRRGLILYPGSGAQDGVRGDHLLIGPPLSITAGELGELLELLDEALGAAYGELARAEINRS